MPEFFHRFSMLEIDFLPGKSRNFRQLAMQSISLDKLSCFPAKKIDLKNKTIPIL